MRQLKIFLAEDNPGDVVLIRTAIQQLGLEFELHIAKDGDQAVAILERIGSEIAVPDIVLLDLNLPRILGPELFRLVRAHPACAKLPIVVVTSSDSPKDHAWTSEYGISHYFQKPSDFDKYMQLGAIIRGLLPSAVGVGN